MNRVIEKICRSEKSQGHRGHRKVKCRNSQALVMVNLYMKCNVHSSYVKQDSAKSGGRTDGRTDSPDDNNRHPPKFWLRPKNGYNRDVGPMSATLAQH